MDEQNCHRQEIPGASEYVRVRRDDLKIVVDCVFGRKSLPILGEDRAAGERLEAALEAPCPDL
jgi:hypothetical protein